MVSEAQDLFARRLAAEFGVAWRYTKTTVVVKASEELSAEVSQRMNGGLTVGLSGASSEYRHFEAGPEGARLAVSFIQEALAS
jgi:hypothetical protein